MACLAFTGCGGSDSTPAPPPTAARPTSTGQTGVDFISAGALTHSVKALDISLEIAV